MVLVIAWIASSARTAQTARVPRIPAWLPNVRMQSRMERRPTSIVAGHYAQPAPQVLVVAPTRIARARYARAANVSHLPARTMHKTAKKRTSIAAAPIACLASLGRPAMQVLIAKAKFVWHRYVRMRPVTTWSKTARKRISIAAAARAKNVSMAAHVSSPPIARAASVARAQAPTIRGIAKTLAPCASRWRARKQRNDALHGFLGLPLRNFGTMSLIRIPSATASSSRNRT